MNVIYVDDEKPAIDNLRLTTEKFQEIDLLHTFQSGEEALQFARENVVVAVSVTVWALFFRGANAALSPDYAPQGEEENISVLTGLTRMEMRT